MSISWHQPISTNHTTWKISLQSVHPTLEIYSFPPNINRYQLITQLKTYLFRANTQPTLEMCCFIQTEKRKMPLLHISDNTKIFGILRSRMKKAKATFLLWICVHVFWGHSLVQETDFPQNVFFSFLVIWKQFPPPLLLPAPPLGTIPSLETPQADSVI